MNKNDNNNSAAKTPISRRRALGLLALGSSAGVMPALAFAQAKSPASEAVVETAHGRVKGFLEDRVYHFLGVRYGAPAGGENRFKPPRPPQPWTGVRDALAFGNSALQQNPDSKSTAAPNPAESEDCLFLNVYTSSPVQNRKRPVMVWLHGGAFSSGSASAPDSHGANLVRRGDAVVVGINHRLNGFGYTHLAAFGGEEFAHSGNVGMLDIILALQWVRDNIDRFGGDPARVMIFGESGGGQKVSVLMASPLAKGLFSRAVIESGPGTRMIEEAEANKTGELFLQELGLNRRNFSDIYQLPQEKLLRAYFSTLAKRGGIVAGFVYDFGPVIDGYFMKGHPFSNSTVAVSADVPLILGWNRTEMTLFAQGDNSVFALDENGMRERVSKIHGADNGKHIVEVYRSKYPGLSPTDLYFLIWSDYPTMLFSNFIAEQRAARKQAPTWLYRFDWETPVMGGKLKTPHTLEIPFVFDNIAFTPNLTGTGENAFKLAAKMSETWLRFAETGNPNGTHGVLPNWQPYDADGRATMLVNNESRLVMDPEKDERILQKSIYP